MTNPTLMGSPLWVAAGWTMVHFYWIGAALGLAGLMGRRALRAARPEARYALALTVLAVMAVVPAATFAWLYEPSIRSAAIRTTPALQGSMAETTVLEQQSTRRPEVQSPRPAESGGQWQAPANALVRLLPWVWLAGSPLTFTLLACGLIGAERYKRQSHMIESGEIPLLCQRLARALCLSRQVVIGVCDQLATPVLIGILRPVILLPPAALNGWTIEQLEMVLWHELAHLRRWDNLINLIQRIVESLLFFHPAVWWVSAWARLEREHCCDLIVVERTGRARAYAGALAALAGAPIARRAPLAVALAESQIVVRIRRILEFHEHQKTMKFSQLSVAGAAALVLGPIFFVGAYAWRPDQTPSDGHGSAAALAQAPATTPDQPIPNGRRARTEMFKAAARTRRPNEPEWKPRPVPQTVPIRVQGQTRDELGKPIGRAMIFVYSTGTLGTKLVGQATSDEQGNYTIAESQLPVVTAYYGSVFPLPIEITPYAPFVVCGIAPGWGLAWSQQQSIYAFAEPHPDDIQHRLPLGEPVEVSLAFPKAASLAGRVTDEDGKPVADCKVQIDWADVLDDNGQETKNSLNGLWQVLPGSIGLTRTDGEGRFVVDRLPDRATFRLAVHRPEFAQTRLTLFTATIDGLKIAPGRKLMGGVNGPFPHEIKTGNLEITFPKLRRIVVSLVGDDTQQPVPGISVYSLGYNFQMGFNSFGTTDTAGRAILALPPGKHRVIRAEPASIESQYIRTEEGPLVVEPGSDEQHFEVVFKSGCELQIEAIDAATNKPVPDAFFWKVSVDEPAVRERIQVSTFAEYGEPLTNEAGMLRAVLRPEPKKLYQFEFAGMGKPNNGGVINPDAANKQGYSSDPTLSEPVELEAGKTIRLRFLIRKSE
jgi:beta-lactamase regulating signal transducer with metallopeptidase domain